MGLLKRDIELRLDLTNWCNLRCVMCSHGYDTELKHQAKNYITIDYFKKFVCEILPRVNIINLSIGNEPLLNRDLAEILEACHKANIPQVVMTTNLMPLTDKIAEILTDGYVHLLHVSMDAGNRTLYNMVRQNSDFDRVVSNIKKINFLKIKKKSIYPKVVFNYVLMKINFEYLKEFIDLSSRLGIEEINCAEFRIPPNYRNDLVPYGSKGLPKDFDLLKQAIDYHVPEVKDKLIELVKYAAKRGVSLNVPYKFDLNIYSALNKKRLLIIHFWNKSNLLTRRSKIAFTISYIKKFLILKNVCCSFPWRQLIINNSGDVLPCCTWFGSPPMGNINDAPVSKIWGNKNYLGVRKGLQDNNLPIACKNCIVSMKKRHGI